MAQTGRAIIFADAPEWHELLASTYSMDGEHSRELRDAAVVALGRWRDSWASRPEVVVSMSVAGFPQMTGGLADHLAAVGQLDRGGVLIATDPGGAASLSSPQEAALWREAICVGDDLAAKVAGKVVLLVVDASSSQWPITVAAALLRKAAASMVLPLLVHRRP
jgi:ATP-dependent DNA helicase RecQ